MKKLTFLIVAWTFCFELQGQYITIPDGNFAYQLRLSLGCVININQLDTACARNAPDSSLWINVSNIRDLTGVQYFHNLKYLYSSPNEISLIPALPPYLVRLDISGNEVINLPALPSTLQHLDCLGNELTSLPNLPTGITYLNCSWNQLTTLPTLPDSLKHLECGGNPLQVLPALPVYLTYLDCGGTPLTSLPALPHSLETLKSGGTNLTTLPTLPSSLTTLWSQFGQLQSLPALPTLLKTLHVYGNELTNLPALPNGLNDLFCSNNRLMYLPALPSSLRSLAIDHNQLTYLPELPDTLTFLLCGNNPLNCFPKLKVVLYAARFDSTNIVCIPNYGAIKYCNPPLSSFPLCDDSLNNGCDFFWNITGRVFYDVNQDCAYDTVDEHQVYISLSLYDNGILIQKTFTEQGGNYSFDLPNYGTYTIKLDSSYGNIITCPDTGAYTVKVTHADSLFYNIDFGIDTNIYNTIPPAVVKSTFALFPNPATNNVVIDVDEHFIGSTISFREITGKKIKTVVLENRTSQILTSSFASGIYFVTLEHEKERVTKKLIIEK